MKDIRIILNIINLVYLIKSENLNVINSVEFLSIVDYNGYIK